METLLGLLWSLAPATAVTVAVVLALLLAHWVLMRRNAATSGPSLGRPLTMLTLSGLGLLLVILALPLGETTRGQLLGVLGLLLSAALALSATSLLGNAMAGFMLRAVRSFRPGDFVAVSEHFGRVSEQGLFHTEIQTEDGDLTTVPNLYLVSQPVKVVRASGTIVSTCVSLGYDLPHARVEALLGEAVAASELGEPFVQIVELGDFSVTYRAAGFLSDTRLLLAARSRLRGHVLDALHAAGVEIVSPTFMNQRVLGEERRFIPAPARRPDAAETPAAPPEELVFDKANAAESRRYLQSERESLERRIRDVEAQRSKAASDVLRVRLDEELERLERRRSRIDELLEVAGPPEAAG